MTIVQRLMVWTEAEEDIRVALLVGSRGAIEGHPDRLSDYDVLLFTRNRSDYESDEGWLTAFGSVLVKLHGEGEVLGTRVGGWLVQYRDGPKIDFTIGDVHLLERIAEQPELPDVLDTGFHVLIDKDGWTQRLPKASGEAYQGRLPSEATYQDVVNEFWWEVFYVAKHLARGEFLPALYSQECVIRFRCLVPMLEWYARAVHEARGRIGPHGRGLSGALRREEAEQLSRTYLGSSIEEGWTGLFETMAFFRKVSEGVAEQLGFVPQEDLAEKAESLLRDVRES